MTEGVSARTTALLYLGFALTANNQPADAIPVLEKARSLSNGSPAATSVLIQAYAHAGRWPDALRLLAELRSAERPVTILRALS